MGGLRSLTRYGCARVRDVIRLTPLARYAVGANDVGWQRITDHRLDVRDVVEADHPEDDFISEELLRRIHHR